MASDISRRMKQIVESTPCRCGGSFSIAEDEDDPDPDRFPVMLHSVPPCAVFTNAPPDNFLRWVRTGNEYEN